jgi:hypothetical protein
MTVTDPAHVATAKLLREQYRQNLHQPAGLATVEGIGDLGRDLADYDRAFGLAGGLDHDGQVA